MSSTSLKPQQQPVTNRRTRKCGQKPGLKFAALSVLLSLGSSQTCLAATHVLELGAAFGQGVAYEGATDFRNHGINGPSVASMTVAGAAMNNGNYSFSLVQTFATQGFSILFNTGSNSQFFHDIDNTWIFGTDPAQEFSIIGRFDAAGITQRSEILKGTFTSPVDLYQIGAGAHEIHQISITTLNLSPVGIAGQNFLNFFAPGGTLENVTLTDLSLLPNFQVAANGGFRSTGANFLGGRLSFDVLPTGNPAPDSGSGIMVMAGMGLLALRRTGKRNEPLPVQD